jgi:hypothetical protein
MKVNVFVEGYEDQELVAALLIKLGKVVSWQESGKAFSSLTTTGSQIRINATEGWTKLTNGNLFPELQQSLQEGVLNLVIYDADRPGGQQGGHAYRKNTLLQIKSANQLSFELFLLPDNNQDGQLEDLLHNLIPIGNRQVTNCFSAYEACVRGLTAPNGQPYQLPVNKSRIFAYLEVLPLTPAEKQKMEKRRSAKLFDNPEYWDLDAVDVQPLRSFLDQHIQ